MIVQAKSGMGKTAVFVLSTLQLLNAADKNLDTVVLCHTHELAFQVGIYTNILSFKKFFAMILIQLFDIWLDLQGVHAFYQAPAWY